MIKEFDEFPESFEDKPKEREIWVTITRNYSYSELELVEELEKYSHVDLEELAKQQAIKDLCEECSFFSINKSNFEFDIDIL